MQELDRRTIALIALRSRLKLELKIPEFAKGGAGRFTLKCAKEWLGAHIKTRKQALSAINLELGME